MLPAIASTWWVNSIPVEFANNAALEETLGTKNPEANPAVIKIATAIEAVLAIRLCVHFPRTKALNQLRCCQR